MTNDLVSSVRGALIDFLTPLQDAVRNPELRADWLATLGYTDAISANPALIDIFHHAQALIEQLSILDEESLKNWTGLMSVLERGRNVSDLLRELRAFAANPERSKVAEGLEDEIMSLLLANYLRRRHPIAFRVASLLTLIEAREIAALDPSLNSGDVIIRYARILDRFKFASINDLVARPNATISATYFPNEMATGADAWLSATRLFPALSLLADALDLAWQTEYRPTIQVMPSTDEDPEEALIDLPGPGMDEDESLTPSSPLEAAYFAAYHPIFHLTLARAKKNDDNSDVTIQIVSSSREHPGAIPGLIVTISGNANQTGTRGQWKQTFSATGEIPVLVIGADGLSQAPSDNPITGGSAKLQIVSVPAAGSSGPAFMFGSAKGTRLELGSLQFEVNLSYDQTRLAISIDLAAASGALVITPGDGDSFIASVLPAKGVRADLDLGLTWSSEHGLALHGGAGLDTVLPIGLSLGGVTLSTIHMGLRAGNTGLSTEFSASITASIGPMQLVLDRIGIISSLMFPKDGGNFGLADFDAQFKPPSGAGLVIDASVVVGGGYLRFDPQKEEYSGIVDLQIAETIAVKGIGLLTTRLPGGATGYSLVIIIFAEDFAPIQLGLGFTLIGIGGLLAINRTFDETALRAGLKNHTLDSILFPKDPVRNATQLLSNLNKVFPAKKGSHLFGPMAQIAWGTPPLITADLALVLEFGKRLRLLILAQVVAVLPTRENELLRLQMDAVGVIDFDQGTAELDATLYDSRLLKKFVLTGDMALRMQWEGSKNFALAVGGLHPAFNPPTNFPTLKRVAINLSSGDNPRIRCEAYFALTSNTVQFGARAELYAEAHNFSIHGEIGYDVLIQLDPFHFIAGFHAQLQLKHGSSNLFKVKVEGELSGPRPLHIKAKATFEILWWDVSIRVNKTLVKGEPPPLPKPISVLPLLRAALNNPSNWTARLSDGQRPMVTLRAKANTAGEVCIHPLGILTVKQGIVPLNMDISRFGPAAPAGARRFTIDRVSLGGQSETIVPVKDFFAPAQFFEMTDDNKLSRPSFESLPAGVSFGSEKFIFTDTEADWLEVKAIKIETIIVDNTQQTPTPRDPTNRYTLSPILLASQARFGAASVSDLRRTGKAKYSTTKDKYRFVNKGWIIVTAADLSAQPMPGIEAGKPASYSEAVQALNQLKQENLARAAGFKILRPSEMQAID